MLIYAPWKATTVSRIYSPPLKITTFLQTQMF